MHPQLHRHAAAACSLRHACTVAPLRLRHDLCKPRRHISTSIHPQQSQHQHPQHPSVIPPITSSPSEPTFTLPSALYQHYIDTGAVQPDTAQQAVLPYMNDILLRLQPHQLAMQQYWQFLDAWTDRRQRAVNNETARRQRQADAMQQNQSDTQTNTSVFHRLSASIFGRSRPAATSTPPEERYRLSSGSNLDELDTYTVKDGYTSTGKAIWPWLTSKVQQITRNQHSSPGTDYNSIAPEYLPNSYYQLPDAPTPPQPPHGLYMYGSVGSGKTLMMDMLYECTANIVDNRQRVHFNTFLINVFALMHEYHMLSQSQRGLTGSLHPLDFVADRMIGGRRLLFLCFDELQLNDVSEAVILKGLFDRLLQRGIVLVMTGNRAPVDIGQSHLNKTDFNGFLQLLQDRCYMCNISAADYRRVKKTSVNGAGSDDVYTQLSQRYASFPLFDMSADSDALTHFAQSVDTLLQHEMTQHGDTAILLQKQTLSVVQGRQLQVNDAYYGIARFTFDELCARSLGAADYLALASAYHTVVINFIPLLSINDRDKIRRFIWAIDQFYNHHVRIVACVAAHADQLFQTDQLFDQQAIAQENLQYEGEVARRGIGVGNRGSEQLWSGADESFAYARAASRLSEMCGHKYWLQRNQKPNTP